MRGIIVYSSRTGNTRNMAEHIYDGLRNITDIKIYSVDEIASIEEYDFAIIGGWIDKAKLDSKTLNLLKNTEQSNIGLFATLGAMPDSEHGIKVMKNINETLVKKNFLGGYILPGLVDPKLIKKMEGFTGKIVPKKIRNKMIQTGLDSRCATEEELRLAANFFKEKVSNLIKERNYE